MFGFNSQEDQEASPSTRPDSTGAHSAKEEGDDPFWGLDDIPGRLFMCFCTAILVV